MSDLLRHELARLAEGVMMTDLEPGVRRQSRRIVRRRALAVTTAVVAVFSVGTGVAFALRAPVGPPVTPATASPSASPVTPTATSATVKPTAPSVEPSQATDRTLVGCTGSDAAGTPVATVPGTVFTQTRRGDGCLTLLEYRDGQRRVRLSIPAAIGGDAATNSLAVSPDGRRVAWVCCQAGTGYTGDLVIAAMDGSAARRVLTGVSWSGGDGPAWLDDSRTVQVMKAGRAYRVDAVTGRATQAENLGAYPVTSPDGRTRAHRADSGAIVITGPDGTELRRVTDYGDPTGTGQGISLQGVTDGGRYVIVNIRNTDPDRVLGGRVVLDTTTGKVVRVPASLRQGATLSHVLPAAGGGFLVVEATNTDTQVLYQVDGELRETAKHTVPKLTGTPHRYVS